MNPLLPLATFVALAALAPPAHADAPTLRVVVVDGVTLASIPRATVGHAGRTQVTGDDGQVTLAGTHAADVRVSAPGYEASTQRIEPGTEPTLVLLFAPGALEVVEVRAQAPHALTGAYVLGADEIRNVPGGRNDALAAVRSLPGIGSAPPVAAGRLVIRGGAPQDSLLTIDGIPVPFIYHSFDHSTIVPASMIGAMTYNPGGFGVEEGRATSGTVGILTRDEPPARATATGTLALMDISATTATPLSRKHGLYLSGGVRRSTVDKVLPLVLDDDAPFEITTPPKYRDAQLQLDWIANPRDRVRLLALTSYDQLGVVNQMPDGDLPADFDHSARFGRLIASWRHETPGVRNRLVAALGNGEFHAKYDTIQHIDDTGVLAIVRDDASVDLSSKIRVHGGVFGQLERHALDARTVVIPTDGLPPGRFDDLPIKTLVTTYGAMYAAGYLATDLRPTETTTITAGVRVDHFGRIDATVLEPRVEIAQRAGTLTLRAAAGRYARDLSQAQALATDLAPELATQVSGGTEIALAEGLSARATVYYTSRDQLAVDDPTRMTAPDELAYTSTGSGSSGGVDLLLRLTRDDLFAWIAYSYGNTTRRDRAGEAPHPTAFDQTHTLSALASYQAGPWRFGARFGLTTGLPYTDVVGATYSEELARYLPTFGAPYGTRHADVAQLDLRVERTWKTRHVDISAFIDFANVFRTARVHRYSYSADFSERAPLSEYVPFPSIGVRGEL